MAVRIVLALGGNARLKRGKTMMAELQLVETDRTNFGRTTTLLTTACRDWTFASEGQNVRHKMVSANRRTGKSFTMTETLQEWTRTFFR